MANPFDRRGQLDLTLFDPALLEQTHDLEDVIAWAVRTQSPHIESAHFLMMLVSIPGSLSQRFFSSKDIPPKEFVESLGDCVLHDPHASAPEQLNLRFLDDSARAMFYAVTQDQDEEKRKPYIGEGQLLLTALENPTPRVRRIWSFIGVDPQPLIEALHALLTNGNGPLTVFDADGMVCLDSFSAGGRRVLDLMKTEAESLGYSQIDARHLLLALLEFEGGATQAAVYQQDQLPKKIQEKVMANLRGRAQKRRSQLTLHKEHLDYSVRQILEWSGQEADAEFAARIAEVHLFRAFLRIQTFAARQLRDAGVDLAAAAQSAQDFSLPDETAADPTAGMRAWENIRTELRQALVGQDATVELCLRFIKRMLVGFRHPNRPVGVFLFCGPSGTGKTEMAKAMARAVFGSEDNLLMLEMGQFQTRESMNIFVGAPPGYVGYGQGKLTNGLRDKPRAVVLFDEIEKADSEVFNALLRFLDEGKIDDPAGPIRDGSECIIVMTSNVQITDDKTDELEKLLNQGSNAQTRLLIRRKLREVLLNAGAPGASSDLRRTFRFTPEFLNRIDEIVLFKKLDEADFTEIAERCLKKYQDRLEKEMSIQVTYSPSLGAAAFCIGRFCAQMEEGARAVPRVVQSAVVDPILDKMHERNLQPPFTVKVELTPHESPEEEPWGEVIVLD
jgi:ATP-dependent Clp protease ATP-binding subunit ClpA